jgi:hypothetical protein
MPIQHLLARARGLIAEAGLKALAMLLRLVRQLSSASQTVEEAAPPRRLITRLEPRRLPSARAATSPLEHGDEPARSAHAMRRASNGSMAR